jgi:cytoskeletal protein RodZ
MKKFKGPDLKMPDLKVPGFVTDLYYDLRDRRLLPLVAFVLVAIVAVPFLLSGGSSESGPPKVEPPVGDSANASQLTVVKATPGLRDYRKRLQGRSAKDPFRAPETKPDLSDAQLGTEGDNGFESSEVTSTSTSTSTTSEGTKTETKKTTKDENGVVTTETETKTEADEPGSSGEGTPGGITLFAFAIDVRIKKATTTPDGGTNSSDPVTRSRVLSPAPLPGEKAQVVTYAGISPKTKNPLFLVSDEVTSVFGEATCLSGDKTCQLLEVEKGMPLTFVYGPAGDRYKITVLKIFPVTAGKF